MDEKSIFVSAGIDVSADLLHLFLRSKDFGKDDRKKEERRDGVYKTFPNTSSGITSLCEFLKENDIARERIVMESTGRYHGLCAVMLTEANFSVFVINPLLSKKYQQSGIRKTKTDKQDAKILAEIALKEEKLPLFSGTRTTLCIRQKISLLKSLELACQQQKAVIKNYKQSIETLGGELSVIEKKVEENTQNLWKTKESLEKEIIALIFATLPEVSEILESIKAESREQNTGKEKIKHSPQAIIKSIPGVSEYLGALILFFFSWEKGSSLQKWVAFCGLEVTVSQSGSWKGKGRLSKRGNKYLRKRLFSGGWGATMNSEYFRKYYDSLKEKGRGHVEALTIISRKLLRITASCLKNQQLFNPQLLSEIPTTAIKI